MSLERWRRSLGLGEWLIFFYLLAFVRQYYWVFSDNRLAWAFTAITTIVVWLIYLKFKSPSDEKTPLQFWLLVAFPLLLFYLLRAPFPDISFDVLNYRLVQSERALYGPPFFPGDFFPVIFPLNPSPDLITGIFRHFLGYRLGTILNYLTVIWLGLVINKFLRKLVPNGSIRAVVILLVLLSEHIFFQINTYMVDLLALPLLLEAAWVISNYQVSKNRSRDLIFVAALLGSSMAIKLSNVTAIIPLTIWLAFEFFGVNRRLNPKLIAILFIALGVFLLPVLPHAIYIYRETGSPFFPLYNEVFKSAYWPEINVGDGRWGPKGWVETILWPLLTSFYPKRLSELGVYSGRMSLAWLSALLCLLLPRSSRLMRGVAFVVLAGALLWALSSGYARYALIFEVLGGILIVYLVARLRTRLVNRPWPVQWAAVSLPLLLVITQASLALYYAYQTEWGGRVTVFDRPKDYLAEAQYFFHDHNLSKFLTPDKKPLIWDVDAWIVSSVKSSGVEVLLRNKVPMMGIHNLEYFDMPRSRERFAGALAMNSGKRMFSLALNDENEAAVTNLRRRGFQVIQSTPLRVPFYSNNIALPMVLFELAPLNKTLPPKPANPVTTAANEPLPDEAFSAELSLTAAAPVKLARGQKQMVNVVVKNASDSIWPASGREDGRFFINVSDTWLGDKGNLVSNMDGRSKLPHDLWPGDSVQIPLLITAPTTTGEYILEIDMVQEGVTFFKAKGSKVLRLNIKVE